MYKTNMSFLSAVVCSSASAIHSPCVRCFGGRKKRESKVLGFNFSSVSFSALAYLFHKSSATYLFNRLLYTLFNVLILLTNVVFSGFLFRLLSLHESGMT
jgi:hypothetical protein